ncbi:phospholipase D-like domain-containing protein [Bradyrhizobium canariense]|uniref:PLD-like domain-containing protein n=1 Tax=Bradyrhizobium canariense TaxID=255045 RepID=A0A1H1ZRF1_9BRAD|nr:phospholipase D-like domain-containing protein [Bradyrhizobium canariense]SDT36401.1 PLD-like domain-containing protein [Bradyrhizobium canariense]
MDKEFSFRTAMIANADGADVSLQNTDHSMRCNADVEVLFRNLTEKLVEQISSADAVFGCVAWLTSMPVLNALATKKAVGIVVQKEDFLRPDSGDWKQKRQREAYAKLPKFIRYSLCQTGRYDYAGSPESDAVRCVGAHNSAKSAAFPRMHNKFLVFCRTVTVDEESSNEGYEPYAVWTGSFNLTHNASNSLENAILIRDEKISTAFLDEFGLIFGLSEKLNWRQSWSAPEYRIGS